MSTSPVDASKPIEDIEATLDGVWAPFEERGDARQSGRSAGRLESIDCYRWPRIRPSILCYPILLHGTPPHSHSIVPGGFDVTSYTTRFTPLTSLMIRVAVSPRNFISNG